MLLGFAIHKETKLVGELLQVSLLSALSHDKDLTEKDDDDDRRLSELKWIGCGGEVSFIL